MTMKTAFDNHGNIKTNYIHSQTITKLVGSHQKFLRSKIFLFLS